MHDNIRYYKGRNKVRKLSKQSPQRTALYRFLEPNPFGKIGVKHILPVRTCHVFSKMDKELAEKLIKNMIIMIIYVYEKINKFRLEHVLFLLSRVSKHIDFALKVLNIHLLGPHFNEKKYLSREVERVDLNEYM